jgi:hypothetical protein
MTAGDLYDTPAELQPFVRRVATHQGAVWFVATNAVTWLEKGQWLLDTVPTITDVELREVTMQGDPPRWNPLFGSILESPLLLRVRGLHLSHNWLTDKDAACLAASSQVGHMERLDLSYNRIGEAGAEAIWSSPNLQGLKMLGFLGNPVELLTKALADWNGAVVSTETPELQARLLKKYGSRQWLNAEAGWNPRD